MTRTVAAIRLEALPIAAVRKREPDLLKHPLVVMERGRVVCCDSQARNMGVMQGMPGHTLSARIVRRDRASLEERRLRDTVHQRLQRYTPLVEIAPHHLWLIDVTGTRRVHGVPEVMTVDRILKELEQGLSIPAVGGVAPSRGVALAAEAAAGRSPLQWVRVMSGQEARFLSPLPVTLIPGIGRAIGRRLSRLGIERMGHLAAVPMDRLVRAFGRRAIQWWQIAQGRDQTPVLPGIQTPPLLQESVLLRADSQGDATLRNRLADVCERLGERLRRNRQYAHSVLVSMTYLDGDRGAGRYTLSPVSNRNADLLQAVWHGLNRARKRRVMLRRVVVDVVQTVGARPYSLFADDTSDNALCRPNLDEAIDAIRARYGREMIGYPRMPFSSR